MKTFLIIFSLILTFIAIFLLETSGYENRIVVQSESGPLFLGITILIGSSLVALSVCCLGRGNRQSLHSNYLDFTKALQHGPLSEEDFEKALGQTIQLYSGGTKGVLSDDQIQSLNQLIYEGKIIRQSNQLSLPQ